MISSTTPEARDALSRELCAYTNRYLQRHRLMVGVGPYRHNAALVFRRLQLAYVESLIVRRLLSENIEAAAEVGIDLGLFAPEKRESRLRQLLRVLRRGRIGPYLPRIPKMRLPALRIPGARTVRRMMQELRLEALFSRKNSFRTAGVRRLFFVDGGEIKTSHLQGRTYTYPKYLEGLLDLDSETWPHDVLIVLYGNLSALSDTLLEHPSVLLLAGFTTPHDESAATDAVEDACWSSYFDSNEASRDLLAGVDATFMRTVFDIALREDLAFVRGVERILSYFSQSLEIVVDTFDARLFSVAQFILENMPRHSVTALQKVLGPYTFSFDFRDHGGVYREPSRIITWGPFHESRLRHLGFTCPIENRRMFRLSAYDGLRTLDPLKIKARLNIPRDMKVVMFSAVQTVVGYPLIEPWQFVQMLSDVAAVAESHRLFVIVKPWPGDDHQRLHETARRVMRNNWLFFHEDMIAEYHNAELLRVTDILISTMSSFIGEALFFDAVPILVTNRACEAYFSPEYTQIFRRFCLAADEQTPLAQALTRAVEMPDWSRDAFMERSADAAEEVFGSMATAPPKKRPLAVSSL